VHHRGRPAYKLRQRQRERRERLAQRQATREELERDKGAEESKHLFRDYVATAVNKDHNESLGRALDAATADAAVARRDEEKLRRRERRASRDIKAGPGEAARREAMRADAANARAAANEKLRKEFKRISGLRKQIIERAAADDAAAAAAAASEAQANLKDPRRRRKAAPAGVWGFFGRASRSVVE